ncbi:MAG: hypothetical protein II026_02345 [Bacteroidales bacterium]|nr:hypothetical protein [Bacteroidales bacterium]
MNFDKKGGQAKVIAYFPEEDEVSLNDEWEIGTSDVLRDPLIKDERIKIQRAKLDETLRMPAKFVTIKGLRLLVVHESPFARL